MTQPGWGVNGNYSRTANNQRRPALERRPDEQRLRRLHRRDGAAARAQPAGCADGRDRHAARPRCVSSTGPRRPPTAAAPITGYQITPYAGVARAGSRAHRLPRRRPSRSAASPTATAYTFTVAAHQRGGHRPRLRAERPTTPEPAPPPGPPLDVVATPATVRPRSPGRRRRPTAAARSSSYRITPYIGRQPADADQTGSTATSYTVTGLTNGTTYTFTVPPINASGYGTPSRIQSNARDAGSAGGARRADGRDRRAARQRGRADLDGSGLGRRQRDHELSDHAVHRRHCPDAGHTLGRAATGFTVTGLTNGTAYTFTVAATNARRHGPGLRSVAAGHAGRPAARTRSCSRTATQAPRAGSSTTTTRRSTRRSRATRP